MVNVLHPCKRSIGVGILIQNTIFGQKMVKQADKKGITKRPLAAQHENFFNGFLFWVDGGSNLFYLLNIHLAIYY